MSQFPESPNPYSASNQWEPASPARRRGMPWWGWLLVGIGAVVFLPCLTCVGWIAYVGAVGPETSVYVGNQTPNRFIDIMHDVGALEADEQLQYFYSDAVTDIRNGFYFVSDRHVVIYMEDAGGDPLTIIPFSEIADVTLSRDESFLIDSQIDLERTDGRWFSFPVSSEHDRDVRFHEAILAGMEDAPSP
ncbi:MAG: hypothetical protein WD534_14755 [Phycisphaeraceae bacterium]